MLRIIRCPKHNKVLEYYKDTSTHTLFKCPNCDYVHLPGVVHPDLPEKYDKLQTKNDKLKEALEVAKGIIMTPFERHNVKSSLEKIEQALKGE